MAAVCVSPRLPTLRAAARQPQARSSAAVVPQRCRVAPRRAALLLLAPRAPARSARLLPVAPRASLGGPLLQLAASGAPAKAAAVALAAAPLALDAATTGWLFVCTAMVLFMNLPGLCLFYGGMLDAKNMVRTGPPLLLSPPSPHTAASASLFSSGA